MDTERQTRLDEIFKFNDLIDQVLTHDGYQSIVQSADWIIDSEPCGRIALLAELDGAFPHLSRAFLAKLIDHLIGEGEAFYRFREERSGQLTRIH